MTISGSAEEKRQQAERIVQAIVPEAKCEIHDYENRIKCGLVDTDGAKKEFSLVLETLEADILESNARALRARLVRQS